MVERLQNSVIYSVYYTLYIVHCMLKLNFLQVDNSDFLSR